MKKIFLLLSIYVYLLNYSLAQLTLASVEGVSPGRNRTCKNPISTSSETRCIGLCVAIITTTFEGRTVTFIDPYTNQSRDVLAGTKARTLSFSDECHKNSAITNPKIVYILNTYQPYNPDPIGELTYLNDEVAAPQSAICLFTNGRDLNTITGNILLQNKFKSKGETKC